MKKSVTLFMVAVFSLSVNTQIFAEEVVLPVPFNVDNWNNNSHGIGSDIYMEGESLVLEVMFSAEFAWQGMSYYVIDLDLDVYPNLRVTINEESSAQWNLKFSHPNLDDQTSPFSLPDMTEYGKRECVVEEVIGESGVVSFELWMWAIGNGQRIIIDQLEFFGGEEESSIDNLNVKPCIVHAEKGKLNFNGADSKEVSVYSVSGQLIKQFSTNPGETSVELKSGLYLVKVGSETIKVVIP